MKKIFHLLINLLLLPSIVKADVAAPDVIDYDTSIYICIIIGVLVCITAVVTIILVNKKKKSKKL